jgi:hypothetical protein
MCFNPCPERRVPSPNRYIADAKFCFCKNNKRIIIKWSAKSRGWVLDRSMEERCPHDTLPRRGTGRSSVSHDSEGETIALQWLTIVVEEATNRGNFGLWTLESWIRNNGIIRKDPKAIHGDD